MTPALKKETQGIIDVYHFPCKPEELKSKTTLNWLAITCHHKPGLSPEFIRYFKDNLRMYWLCAQQQMPEDLIMEMEDEVDWKMIFKCQFGISDAFREANRHRITSDHVEFDPEIFHSWESWTQAWILWNELHGESLEKECLKLARKNLDLAIKKFADHIKFYNHVNIRSRTEWRTCTPEQIEEDLVNFIKIDFEWRLEQNCKNG